MAVFSERAILYAKDSLNINKSIRQKANEVVIDLKAKEVSQVSLEGKDAIMDILRLTCVEDGIEGKELRSAVLLKPDGQEYEIVSRVKIHKFKKVL